MSASSSGASRGLRTSSLRRRVAVSVIVVLVGALLLGSLLVQSLFTAQSTANLQGQLHTTATSAAVRDRRNQPPERIAEHASRRGIVASVRLADGTEVGPGVGAVVPRGDERLVYSRRLPSGDTLTLINVTDTVGVAGARLSRVMLMVGIGIVSVTVLALVIAVKLALRPLDAMTSLANSITHGRRGGRLDPSRADTELGRAASAFDGMLNALEGAERNAQQSEERTRKFVADAAHELRTPIAGVQAATETVLRSGPEMDAEARERMNFLLAKETKRAAHLVDDLLALARIDAGVDLTMQPVDLHELTATEIDTMRVRAPTVRWELEGESCIVDGDSTKLEQVLTNLLDNARRHTPFDGDVHVRVAGNAEQAEVTVADSGPGVDPAQREAIFDRLIRLDPDGDTGGAGLGLSIARGLARAHGGDVTCLNPQDVPWASRGGVFHLVLPRS